MIYSVVQSISDFGARINCASTNSLNHYFESVGVAKAANTCQTGHGGGYEDTERDRHEDLDRVSEKLTG